MHAQTRRRFLRTAVTTSAAVALSSHLVSTLERAAATVTTAPAQATVALVKTDGHRDGVLRALRLLDPLRVQGRSVVIKPNLNSSDPFPASTHPETLRTLIDFCQAGGASEIVVADRSGMGATPQVMRETGVERLAAERGIRAVALDSLPATQWTPRIVTGGHWRRGLLFPTLLERADVIIQTCCLKTHRFGGQFSLSLKNSVGMVAKRHPDGYDYMQELHGSALQRSLIAEINTLYRPAVVVLDGIEAFVSGGPDRGQLAHPGVVIAGSDRVAVDAVGVALLRVHGVTGPVASGPIFGQEQIRRAVELALGVSSGAAIELRTDNPAAEAVVRAVRTELARA